MNFLNIIICAYNEERSIERCIESVDNSLREAEHLGLDISVYIIDNESKDRTFMIAENATKELDRFSIIQMQHSSLSVSRNQYRNTDNSEFVAYIDADGAVSESWLTTLLKILERGHYDIVGGRVKDISNSPNPVFELFYNQDVLGSYIMGANMVIRRSLLDELGGFPELFYSRGDESGMLAAASRLQTKPCQFYERNLIAYNEFDASFSSYLRCLVKDSQRHFLLDKRFKDKGLLFLKLFYRLVYLIPIFLVALDPRNAPFYILMVATISIIRKPRVVVRQMRFLGSAKLPFPRKVLLSIGVLFSELFASIGYLWASLGVAKKL